MSLGTHSYKDITFTDVSFITQENRIFEELK